MIYILLIVWAIVGDTVWPVVAGVVMLAIEAFDSDTPKYRRGIRRVRR